MRLIDISHFDHIFAQFSGKFVSVVEGWGNVGDKFIFQSTRQLLDEYKVLYEVIGEPNDVRGEACLLFGGGNLGSNYFAECDIRERFASAAEAKGIPTVVLPQSIMKPVSRRYSQVFIREPYSMLLYNGGMIAPDLAMGYDFNLYQEPLHDLGIFLRRDGEAQHAKHNYPDPAIIAPTVLEYFTLAGMYKKIITDRLHFAICALYHKRDVTLLPNSYHKNRGMWEMWLEPLGCKWQNKLERKQII